MTCFSFCFFCFVLKGRLIILFWEYWHSLHNIAPHAAAGIPEVGARPKPPLLYSRCVAQANWLNPLVLFRAPWRVRRADVDSKCDNINEGSHKIPPHPPSSCSTDICGWKTNPWSMLLLNLLLSSYRSSSLIDISGLFFFFFLWKGQSKVQTAPRWENIDAWRQFAHARSECVCIKRIVGKECVLNACAALIHSICKRKPPRKRLVCLDKAVQVYCMLESHHCHHHDGHCWLIVWRRCTKHKYSLKPIQQWAPVMTPPLCWREVHAHTHTRVSAESVWKGRAPTH